MTTQHQTKKARHEYVSHNVHNKSERSTYQYTPRATQSQLEARELFKNFKVFLRVMTKILTRFDNEC